MVERKSLGASSCGKGILVVLLPILGFSIPFNGIAVTPAEIQGNEGKLKKPKNPGAYGKQAALRFKSKNLAHLQPQLIGSTSNGENSKRPMISVSSSCLQAAGLWPENVAHFKSQSTESSFGGPSDDGGTEDEDDEEESLIITDEPVLSDVKIENYSSDSESNAP